ncbi:MAG TPA: hypothetical protein VG651_24705 [Stellaceae bacterium]|nr:hypothetical protein [Stellaceae bacterium]
MDEHSRPDANSNEQAFTLTVEEAAELYATAGFPRTLRAIQKYCARDDLLCIREQTPFGVRFRITPSSVARHIEQIKQLSQANRRDHSRPDANVRTDIVEPQSPKNDKPTVREQPRPDAAVRADQEAEIASREHSRTDANDVFEHPYVKRLEAEVDRLHDKLDKQVRRTEEVMIDANKRLIELQQANAIASSETLAKYMLQLRAGGVIEADLDETAGAGG